MNSSKVTDLVSEVIDLVSDDESQNSPKRKLTATDDKAPKSPKITEYLEEEVPPLNIPTKKPTNEPQSEPRKRHIKIQINQPQSKPNSNEPDINDPDFIPGYEEVLDKYYFIGRSLFAGTASESNNTLYQQSVEKASRQPFLASFFETSTDAISDTASNSSQSTDAISDTASNSSQSMFSNMSTPPPPLRKGKSDEDFQ